MEANEAGNYAEGYDTGFAWATNSDSDWEMIEYWYWQRREGVEAIKLAPDLDAKEDDTDVKDELETGDVPTTAEATAGFVDGACDAYAVSDGQPRIYTP